MLYDQEGVEKWQNEMKQIQHEKRNRDYEQPIQYIRSHKQMKAEEQVFNPILQKFSDQEKDTLAQTQKFEQIQKDLKKQKEPLEKYQRPYNILNLQKRQDVPDVQVENTKKQLIPVFRDFNIINNGNLEDHYFKNVKVLKQNKVVEKTFDESKQRQFNIINNVYKKDHEEKTKQEHEQWSSNIHKKYDEQLNFNIVKGAYYNEQKEQEYQEKLRKEQLEHGKDNQFKLPPSMIWRESVIVDPTIQVPEAIKRIDEKNRQKKKRYELKYAIEQEYKERDIENDEKNLKRVQNRLHDDKYTEEHKKGFNILNLEPTKEYMENLQHFIHKKPKQNTWQKIEHTAGVVSQQAEEQAVHSENQIVQQDNQNQQVAQDNHAQDNQEQVERVEGVQSKNRKSEPEIVPQRFNVNEQELRERYHMPPSSKTFLPRLERKKQDPSIKVNHSKPPEIQPKTYQQQVQAEDLKIKPKWVEPTKRIKTGGFQQTR